MPTCSAFGCSYKHCRKKIVGKSVHRFPFSRPHMLKLWVYNIRRSNWTPNKGSVLCSDHFTEDCFDRSGNCIRLKSHAVPTIFNFPQHFKKTNKMRKAPLQRNFTQPELKNEEKKSECLPSTSVTLDHNYHSSPSKLKKIILIQDKQIIHSKMKLKMKQQEIRRLKKKVHLLNDIVDKLKSENLVSESAASILLKTFSPVPASVFS